MLPNKKFDPIREIEMETRNVNFRVGNECTILLEQNKMNKKGKEEKKTTKKR